jgi:hypothetical protein
MVQFKYYEQYIKEGKVLSTPVETLTEPELLNLGYDKPTIEWIILKNGFSDAIGNNRWCQIEMV